MAQTNSPADIGSTTQSFMGGNGQAFIQLTTGVQLNAPAGDNLSLGSGIIQMDSANVVVNGSNILLNSGTGFAITISASAMTFDIGSAYYFTFPATNAIGALLSDGSGSFTWGTVPLAYGGTGTSLTLIPGGVVYCDGATLVMSAGATGNNQMLQSFGGAPFWTTSIWPATTAANRILYSSSDNVVNEILTANSSVLTTNGSGVPAWSNYTVVSPIQYVQVSLTAANLLGMYATPVSLIAAPGASRMIIIVSASFELIYNTTQYLLGGAIIIQYGSSAHGAGDNCMGTTTLGATDLTTTTTATLFTFPQGATSVSYATGTDANAAVYISNQTAAFTTGNSTAKVNLAYYVIAV